MCVSFPTVADTKSDLVCSPQLQTIEMKEIPYERQAVMSKMECN